MKLYVGNLSYNAGESELEALFAGYGEVSSVRVITDRETGRSRGFAFVEMPNKQEAIEAMKGLAEMEFNGRPLVVNEARPRN